MHSGTRSIMLAGAGGLIAIATPVAAQTQASVRYDIPSQDLAAALRQVGRVADVEILFTPGDVAGMTAPQVRGQFTLAEVLDRLLGATGLTASYANGAVVIRGRSAPPRTEATDAAETNADILVTGTRIRGAAPIGSVLTTIDRKAIERSGYATTQDIAQTIPQNFGGSPNETTAAGSLIAGTGANTGAGSSLNLRGLGNGSTLVLLNGDRPPLAGFAGVFADISMIPAVAVDRIEVVADGSSAIYGSDAVAGVVNIVPRLRFRGAETSVRLGTADGDSQDIVASQIVGARWNGGHVVGAYEFYRRSRLRAADRDYVTDDLRAFGGPDLRTTYASPGTIVAGGTTFAIPRGQDGRGLRASSLTAGTSNLGDSWSQVDVLPTQRRHSAFLAAEQELGRHVRVYAQGLYSVRDYEQFSRTITDTARTVPITNPFYVDPIGTNRPVSVRYDFGRDLGREKQTGHVEAYGATIGLAADLGRWGIDLRNNWGRQSERYTILNRVNSARLAAALADTNPATAYNLFGDGPSTNPATIDRVRGSTQSAQSGTTWSTSARADGPLIALPAGDVRIAAGGEYRVESYHDDLRINDTSTLVPTTSPEIQLPGPRRVRALYAEALVPVFGGEATLPGFHRFDISAALRTERYNDFGTTTNPKFGARWEPVRGLALRGTYGKSFRAPSINNLRQDPGIALYFAYTIPDPLAASGQSDVLVVRGNDPDLKPEKATSWTLGLDLEPAMVPGLKLSGTYYHIDYRDRISSPAAQLFNFLVNRSTYQGIIDFAPTPQAIQAYYASPIFQNPFNIAPTAISAIVDAQLQNLAVVHQSGLDIDAGYAFKVAGGDAEIGATASYIFDIRQGLTPQAPTIDVVDTVGNPVDLRIRGRGSWTGERWSLALFANYLDSYTNLTNSVPQKVRASATIDAQVGYKFDARSGPFHGLKIALSATNLFDRDPPYVAYNLGLFITGYDPDNASPLGRVVSLQLTKSW